MSTVNQWSAQIKQNSKKPRTDFQIFTYHRNYKKRLWYRAINNFSNFAFITTRRDKVDINFTLLSTTEYRLFTDEEIKKLEQIKKLFTELNDNWKEEHRKLVEEGYCNEIIIK